MFFFQISECQTMTVIAKRFLTHSQSFSLAPSYVKSASFFSLVRHYGSSKYTELWKTVNFFFCNVMQLFFYFIFSTSISKGWGIYSFNIALYIEILLKISIFLLSFAYFSLHLCRQFLKYIKKCTEFCKKNFSFTKCHAIAKIDLKFHNFNVIHST